MQQVGIANLICDIWFLDQLSLKNMIHWKCNIVDCVTFCFDMRSTHLQYNNSSLSPMIWSEGRLFCVIAIKSFIHSVIHSFPVASVVIESIAGWF